MIDLKTLLPMVKKLLPDEADADLTAGIQEFAKAHPDLGNKEALQALITALKQAQSGGNQGQPQPAAPAPAPAKPFGQGVLGALGSN